MAEKKKKKNLLHELLEDDQEPFFLNHYISDLRSQMGYSDLRVKKRKSDNNAATMFPPTFFSCESSCFFAKSPDPRKSPLFELRSPAKNGRVFLQIPARTAAILVEAAARIQKQQSEKKAKTNNKARNRGNGFGMFGSVLKRLTNRKQKPRFDGNAISSERGLEATSSSSSSSRRERFVEISDKCFCESPFRFVLQTSPSTSGHQTPHFISTATSPTRHSSEDEDSDKTESIEKVRGQEEEEEEEDKEQCSPVSVLDPLEEEEEEEDEDHHQHHEILSCSFEIVQRAKRRLLKKLRRFEKLAGLDSEEKMSEEESKETDSDEEMDETMVRERRWMEEERRKKNEERQKKWKMMNAFNVGFDVEEDVEAVVRKDLKEEAGGEWTRYGGEIEEAVSDLELSIFIFLIDEFSNEFVVSSCQ